MKFSVSIYVKSITYKTSTPSSKKTKELFFMEKLQAILESQDELDLNIDSSKVNVQVSESDDDPRITSHFLCTAGCAHTGSFNSYYC